MQNKNIAKSFRGPRSDHKKSAPPPPLFAMTITGQSHRKACKLNIYWKIYGNFFRAPLQGSTFFKGPFLHLPSLQVFVNGPLDKQTYFRKTQLNETWHND